MPRAAARIPRPNPRLGAPGTTAASRCAAVAAPPPPRRWAAGRHSRRRHRPAHQAIADAPHGDEVDWVVGVRLDLLAETAHRYPDVRGVGVVRLAPAAI